MRHEFGFQFEFRVFRQVQSITNSEFSISDLSSFGEEESSFPVWSSAELDFDDGKPVQSNSFSRSISEGVPPTEYFVRSPLVGVVPESLLEWIS